MHTSVVKGVNSVPFSPRRSPFHGHNNEEASGPSLGARRGRSLRGTTANKTALASAINPFKSAGIRNVGSLRRFKRAWGVCLRADSGDSGALRGEAVVRFRDDGSSI